MNNRLTNTRYFPDGGYTRARLTGWSYFDSSPYAYAEWLVLEFTRSHIMYLGARFTVLQQYKEFDFDWWDRYVAQQQGEA
jgi:hypothetical protein